METTHLTRLADALARHIGRSEQTISTRVAGHARLFQRLRAGQGCTVHTWHRAMGWFSANWPEDLPWPTDIPRPPARLVPRPARKDRAA